MAFSTKQVQALRRSLNRRQVRTREANGREFSYIEAWFAISEANRIFGFDGWNRETVKSRCVLARENRGSFLVVYIARVRITVNADGMAIIREGHGSGEGRGTSPGEVHDIALKAAETDATKRALATFGKPFGLELYRKSPAAQKEQLSQPALPTEHTRFGFHPDDTTPIPRPSRYYGRRQSPPVTEQIQQRSSHEQRSAVVAPPIAPATPDPSAGKIDKSSLILAEPKRRRDRVHLRFVASQPCIVCGRHPSDPHHLRFAQPRALGVKVSDEFTVPLCRGHHRQLHQAGNEITWWKTLNIEALPAARHLWEQTHPNEEQVETQKAAYEAKETRPEV
jgi:Rad52/22 family double-strand break repair protein